MVAHVHAARVCAMGAVAASGDCCVGPGKVVLGWDVKYRFYNNFRFN